MTYFWRHDELCDVMPYFWRHDERFDVMTHFSMSLRTFWLSWQICWCHDVFLTSWPSFWPHDVFLTLWLTFQYPDELYDVMTHFLPSWRTFWCHFELFDITYCWHHGKLFDVMANFLTSWRTFWRYDIFCCCVCVVCLYYPCYIIENTWLFSFAIRKLHTHVEWYMGYFNFYGAGNWGHLGVSLATQLCCLSDALVACYICLL